MLRTVVLGLYTALLLGANPAARRGDRGAGAALTGDMRSWSSAEAPVGLPDVPC